MGLRIGNQVELAPRKRDAAALRWALCAGRRAVAGYERKRRKAVEQLPTLPIWVVAQVRVGFEFEIADVLTTQGYFGYTPHKVRLRAHARVGGANAGRRAVEEDYAVLRGYVIIGCPVGRYLVRGEPILKLLGDPVGRPGLAQKTVDDLNRLLVGVAIGDVVDADVAGVTMRGVVSALRRVGVVVDVEMFGANIAVDLDVDRVSRVAL